MEYILVIANIILLFSGILYTGIIVERLIYFKYEVNLYASLIIGLSIIYSIALLGIKLSNIIIYIYIINLYGIIKYYKIVIKIKLNKYLVLISVPIMIAITFQMVWYWDAVVNWFFHAKVIAYADMYSWEIYTDPFPAHGEYPKLLPILAALVSKITSVYNEALPKSSLLYLLMGVLIGFNEVKYFNNNEKIFIYFLLLALMGIHSFSGYLDGWLSIYTSLSCLFLINYYKDNNERDMINLICSLCFLPMMKNEGLAILITFLLILCTNNYRQLKENIINRCGLAFIILIPTFIWTYIKIETNSTLFRSSMFDRIFENITYDVNLLLIYYFIIYSNLIYVIWYPILLWILLKYNKITVQKYLWLPIKLSCVYMFIQIAVYFILVGQNPSSLLHFLEFGVRRTTMPVMMMIFLFNIASLKELNVFTNIFKKV